MNKWFYRAVGTVGIASGIWLLGSGAAQANETDAVGATHDPQLLRGLFDDLLSPTAGLSRLGVPAELPTDLTAALPVRDGAPQNVFQTTGTSRTGVPGVLGALPVTDLLPAAGIGIPTESLPNLPVLGALDGLPLVGELGLQRDLLPAAGDLANGLGVGPGGAVFAIDGTDDPLPAGVADAISSAGTGAAPEDLPLVGGLLGGATGDDQGAAGPLGGLPMLGGLPVVGGLLGGGGAPAGDLDMVEDPDLVDDPSLTDDPRAADEPVDFALSRPAPTARAGERPIVYDASDEYAERAYVPRHAAPASPRHAAPEALPVLGDLGAGLPLLSNVRSLPVLGSLLGGL